MGSDMALTKVLLQDPCPFGLPENIDRGSHDKPDC